MADRPADRARIQADARETAIAQIAAATDTEPAAPTATAVAPLPSSLPPVPDLAAVADIPEHRPFTYAGAEPLTPSDMQVITLFHATYMQAPSLGTQLQGLTGNARTLLLLNFKASAEQTLPLMRQQHTQASIGVDGPQSQEAQQVQKNIQWVEQVLNQMN